MAAHKFQLIEIHQHYDEWICRCGLHLSTLSGNPPVCHYDSVVYVRTDGVTDDILGECDVAIVELIQDS